jgi:Sulfate permease and related transporters (MFS superfamily)
LFAGTRWVRHYLVVPGVIVGAIIVFHLVGAFAGHGLDAARAAGLLLPVPDTMGWDRIAALDFNLVRWDLFAGRIGEIGAMTAVVVVTALMNTTSLEVATGRDGDADRELRAIGLGNLIAAPLGGMIASNSFNRTSLNLSAGATSAWASGVAAALIAAALFAWPGVVGFLPRPVLAGLILYLGASLLGAWALESRRTMGMFDYAIVLFILGVVMILGIVPGVVLGTFISCASFTVAMSRSRNVRHAFTAQTYRSNVERSAAQLERLRTEGAALRGFVLDGVLFFGTASRLLEEIRASLAQTKIVLLDFRRVQGVDGSAIVVLRRVEALCRDLSSKLVLTGLSPELEERLARGGFDFAAPHVRRFADLDRGLEWGEEQILGGAETTSETLDALLGLPPDESGALKQACERRRFVPGELLMRYDEASDTLFFIERGRVHVMLPPEQEGAPVALRLRTYGPGSILGEMGFYTGERRSADVVVEEEVEALCLTRERLAELETTHPALAHTLQRIVIRNLSQRLRAANEEIRDLL